MIDLDLILYSERMVGKDSPDYADTLNRALLQVIDESGADPAAFVGFALRPTVAPTVGQFYVATDVDVGAAWTTLTAAMVSDLTTAATGITKLGTVNTGVWQGTSIATTYTDAKIKTVTGTVNRLSIGGTATDPVFDISSSYVGQATITTLGTIATGVWNATSIGTAYTDAKVVSLSGVSNRTTITGTATVPIVDISATYVGQTSITTLGTIATGAWNGTVIGTAYTTAQVVSLSGTASRITVGGTATVPTVDISAAYIGQTSITTLGTITAGTWNGSVIGVAYTTAQLVSLTGTANRITIGGTSTAPTVDVSTSYVGQATITTLGTIATGTWQGTSIATTYTDAKVKTVTGTANRLTIGGTATDPTFDIAATYVGQASITTLGTIATGTWAATTISVDKGGTGLTSYTIGDTVYASGATTLSKLGIGSAGQFKVVNGGATAPTWVTLTTSLITDLTTATTGITKVGTVTTGVWNAGIISGIYGGTGVNNGSNTITLAGNLVTVGAFSLTLTATGATNVTLPTTGTLVNTAVTSLASLTSVGGAFAISGAFTGATTGAFSSTLSTSQLTITDTASRIIPGATSLSLRNNANNADNFIVLDAGSATLRAGLAIGGALTGVTTLATSRAFNQYQATYASTGTVITGGWFLGANTIDGIHMIVTSNHGFGIGVNNGAPTFYITSAGATTIASGGLTVSAGTTAVQALTATTIGTTGSISVAVASGNPSVSVAAATAGNNPSYRLMNTADGATTAWDMVAVYTNTPDDFQWQYGGSTKMTLSSTGLLTTAGTILVPSTAAYTFAQAPSSGYGFTVVDNGSGSAPNVKIGANGTSGLNLMLFINGNGTVGSIAVSGSATAFNTSSDRDLKIDRGIATTVVTLRELVVHDFDWKIDGRADRGVFAQEAYKVKPSAVSVGDNTVDDNGNKANPWAVDYSKFVPDLIVGWQDHDVKINDHEHRLKMLEVRA